MIDVLTPKLKVLFVSSASHTPSDKNLNHYQRVYFLSRSTDLTILAQKNADFSVSAASGTKVIRSPWPGKLGLILYAIPWILGGQARKHDIILTEPSVLGLLGFLGKLLGGCRWVVDVWDIPIRCVMVPGRVVSLRCSITRRLFRQLYHYADLFVVSILPDFELREFMIPRQKMLLLRNAIWLDGIQKTILSPSMGNDFNLLCMRSVYTLHMGLDTLSKAMQILSEQVPDISLTIIGRIPSHVEPQVAPLRGMTKVSFHNFIEHDALNDLICEASACIVPFHDVPDLAQTYPIKIIEYFALGKPVVASNIAGLSRLIKDGYNGLLYKADDPVDLANKIILLHENEHMRINLGRNASKLDDDFDCRVKNAKILESMLITANNEKAVSIFNYHFFSADVSSGFFCSKKDLLSQLTYLKSNFTLLPLPKAIDMVENNRISGKIACITVDDGDETFFKIAWPIFKELGVPIHVNLVTGSFGKILDCHDLPTKIMNMKEVNILIKSGLVTLSSHTMSHKKMNELSINEQEYEIVESKKIINEIAGESNIFSYPYGGVKVVTSDTEKILNDNGFRYALTTAGNRLVKRTDRFRIGRVNIFNSISADKMRYYSGDTYYHLRNIFNYLKLNRFYNQLSVAGRIGDHDNI